MAEYISREAALKTVCDGCNAEFEEMPCEPGYCYIRNALVDMPAADVVPVVLCRDCKHRDPEDKKCDCGGLEHAHMFPVADDWFCADGEKRE